jgi:hypothetical protein
MHTPDPNGGAERAGQPQTSPGERSPEPRPPARTPSGCWRFLESEGRWAWVPADAD